jgi:hypothetical protein
MNQEDMAKNPMILGKKFVPNTTVWIDPAQIEENSILSDAALLQEIDRSKEDSKAKRLIPWERVSPRIETHD